MHNYLEFEKPIAELEGKIAELRHLSGSEGVNIADEVGRLQAKVEKLLTATYAKLSPWQKTQVARHPERPHARDYIEALIADFVPLRGDRLFAEDEAIVGGIGRFRGQSVCVVGTERGSDTAGRVKHNFGMARPEGYRKAQRLMRLADRFHLPVITFVDTPGAYPGVDAEARGQAEAIARSIDVSLDLKVPLIAVVIGEGGSGGAIALASGNVTMMLEHSVYSVISPEGCASISLARQRLGPGGRRRAEDYRPTPKGAWRDRHDRSGTPGRRHRNRTAVMSAVGNAIAKALEELGDFEPGVLKSKRREKFLNMGNRA